MVNVGVEIQFEGGNMRTDGELIDGGWKPVWKRLKGKLKKGVKNQRATSRLQDIRGSCRSRSIGPWYKSAKGRFEEDFQ